jgi:superfamily II DNA/RNA helicase
MADAGEERNGGPRRIARMSRRRCLQRRRGQLETVVVVAIALVLPLLFSTANAAFSAPLRRPAHPRVPTITASGHDDRSCLFPLSSTITSSHDDDDEGVRNAEELGTTRDGLGMFTSTTFSERYSTTLPQWLIERCAEIGWHHPTRIQEAALDAILIDKHHDCIIQAETGSGKTLCYLLPCLAAIQPTRTAVQVLIVVPTRELGLQVARVAKRLAAGSAGAADGTSSIMIMHVLQGSQNRRQRAWAWAQPPHVVIGTPLELCNMVRLGGIKRYNSVKMVVVDEVDACLLNNGGSVNLVSASTLHELLSKHLSPTYETAVTDPDFLLASSSTTSTSRPLSKKRQTIFCSATIPQHRHFIKQCQQNQWTLQEPVHVCLRPGEQLMPDTLEHAYIVCADSDKKLASLRRVLKKLWIKNNRNDDTASTAAAAATMQSKSYKILIFADAQRPLENMARLLAADVPDNQGLYWREGEANGQKERAIFSVLRYQDSLSQRATAMDVFRGDDYRSMTKTGSRRRSQSSSAKSSGASIFTKDYQEDEVDNGDDDINEEMDVDFSNSKGSSSVNGMNTTTATSSKLRVLFSTDLASRGIDVCDITHVINFDLPPDADTYLHRSGRSGRLGRSGQVVSIVTQQQEFVLQRLANKLGVDMRCIARQQSKPLASKQ